MPDVPHDPHTAPDPVPLRQDRAVALTDDEVRHVARLARLAIPPDQVHRYALQLQDILAYVAKISQVDVEGIEPTAHAVRMHNVFRDDVVGPMLSVEQVLANAPSADPPFFKVPKVIGGDDGESAE